MTSMAAFDASRAIWRKSTRSNGQGGNCVQVADNIPGVIAVRDSKDPEGAHLLFGQAEWRAFIDGAKDGEFDLH